MVALRFDARDLFRSARLAFSFQRLWLQFFGLLVGYTGYVVLTYGSILCAGRNLEVVWDRFGLFPGVAGLPLPWYGWILYGIGIAWLFFFWMVAATSVARATYMNLKGNTFYTWKEALSFSLKRKGGSLIAAPLAILIIGLLTGLGGVVIGLLGRIPVVGELGVSLFAVIWFITSFFLLIVCFALAISLLLTPAILATTDDDAFEGIFQSFSILFSHPVRMIFYQAIVLIIALLSTGAFIWLAKQAWGIMTSLLVMGMGDKYADLSYGATYLLQTWVYPVHMWSKAILGDYAPALLFSREFTSISLSGSMTAATTVFAAMITLIAGYVASFPLAIFNVGQSLIFLMIKKQKDDENLLERKDKEEEFDDEEDEEEAKEEEEESSK